MVEIMSAERRGMREDELRKAADCRICGKPIGKSGIPLFYRVTVERHGVLLDKIRRQDGLAQHLGSPLLAKVMGPDEEMTQVLMQPLTVTVCEPCSLQPHPLAMLVME
jgi:hypothetical protein